MLSLSAATANAVNADAHCDSAHFNAILNSAGSHLEIQLEFCFSETTLQMPPDDNVDIHHSDLIKTLIEHAQEIWNFMYHFRNGVNPHDYVFRTPSPSLSIRNNAKGGGGGKSDEKDVMQIIMAKCLEICGLRRYQNGKDYHKRPFTKTITYKIVEVAAGYFYLIYDRRLYNLMSSDVDKFQIFEAVMKVLKEIIKVNEGTGKLRLLDLTTKLAEGYGIKYITGTGMTPETSKRYDLLHALTGTSKTSRKNKDIRVAGGAGAGCGTCTPSPRTPGTCTASCTPSSADSADYPYEYSTNLHADTLIMGGDATAADQVVSSAGFLVVTPGPPLIIASDNSAFRRVTCAPSNNRFIVPEETQTVASYLREYNIDNTSIYSIGINCFSSSSSYYSSYSDKSAATSADADSPVSITGCSSYSPSTGSVNGFMSMSLFDHVCKGGSQYQPFGGGGGSSSSGSNYRVLGDDENPSPLIYPEMRVVTQTQDAYHPVVRVIPVTADGKRCQLSPLLNQFETTTAHILEHSSQCGFFCVSNSGFGVDPNLQQFDYDFREDLTNFTDQSMDM